MKDINSSEQECGKEEMCPNLHRERCLGTAAVESYTPQLQAPFQAPGRQSSGGTTGSPLPQAAKIFTLPVNPSLGRIVFPRQSFLPAFNFSCGTGVPINSF